MRAPRQALGRALLILALVAACILAATGIVSMRRAGDEADRAKTCGEHFRVLAQAVAMYADDYDDRWPPAASWVDDLLQTPYVKGADLFHCPSDGSGSRSGYAINAALAGGSRTSAPGRHVLLYETTRPGANPAYAGRAAWASMRHRASLSPNPGLGVRVHTLGSLEPGSWVALTDGAAYYAVTSPRPGGYDRYVTSASDLAGHW